jgi:hypothetical protein
MVWELATRIGGASTMCSRPVASSTLSFRVGFCMISPFNRTWKPKSEKQGADARRCYGRCGSRRCVIGDD